MILTESIRIAFRALAANKLRAGLTTLGIVIGIAAVITLLSIGGGVTRYVDEQSVGLGTNLVYVTPNEEIAITESTLTMRDVERLNDDSLVPNVAEVAPTVIRSLDVQFERGQQEATVEASTPAYGSMRNYEVSRGRFIDEEDYNSRSRVAVLGQDVVDALFPIERDPLEANINIGGINFRVIGILEPRGAGALDSQDNLIVVPLSTAGERLFNLRSQSGGQVLVDVIWLQADSSEAIEDIVVDVSLALRDMHDIDFRDSDDFAVFTQQEFLGAFGAVTGALTVFLGAVATISLIVGGIGIMNIMLVSVSERTREIGIRKAVGAKKRDILGQFLTEALCLALIGGLLGIVSGYAGAAAVHLAIPDLDTTVTIDVLLLAIGFSLFVGLFFGVYPAARAATLDPMEALRIE